MMKKRLLIWCALLMFASAGAASAQTFYPQCEALQGEGAPDAAMKKIWTHSKAATRKRANRRSNNFPAPATSA